MKIQSIEPAIISRFEFTKKELLKFGLESEQINYMECEAREWLACAGLPSEGGEMNYWLSYDKRPSTLSIMI